MPSKAKENYRNKQSKHQSSGVKFFLTFMVALSRVLVHQIFNEWSVTRFTGKHGPNVGLPLSVVQEIFG